MATNQIKKKNPFHPDYKHGQQQKHPEREGNKRRTLAPLSVKIKSQIGLKDGEKISQKFPKQVKDLTRRLIPLMPDTKIAKHVMAKAAAKIMTGETHESVAEELKIPLRKIQQIFATSYPERERMDALLETSLLANAHLSNVMFMEKADTLSARDAAVAAGIFSSRFLEVKQHRENKGKPQVNIGVVLQLSGILQRIDEKEKTVKAIEV